MFPRTARYNPAWVKASVSGAAHPLKLAEWLAESLPLKPGMRVLDLGCGRALSSIFLHREFGVRVWAADLWFSPSENWQRVRDAGAGDGVFPLRVDARALPFAAEFFDVVVSHDSCMYYGTDDHSFRQLARFVRPGGTVAIAAAGLMREFEAEVPAHLRAWWTPDLWSLHSAPWWRRHAEKSGVLKVTQADTMPEGWRVWLEWIRDVAAHNTVESRALEEDAGRELGYVRVVATRPPDAVVEEPITSIPAEYSREPLRQPSDS
jgi:cyclopropane fatty-acyl-phospholipid synthase-like methyltransferase